MDLITTDFLNTKKVRLHFLWGLIFSFLLITCTGVKKENKPITIQWSGEKAEGITISKELFKDVTEDSVSKLTKIRLANKSTDILGAFTLSKEAISFKPLIAFTPGLKYEIIFSNSVISQFEIPAINTTEATELLSVYPTADTLPENALKLYITFSKPMQEGKALANITLTKNESDTISSPFLDLAQELWNKERTILTLWFDPGRIKRDLQPNKKSGTPLQQNNSYKIIINKDWRDENGLSLKSTYEKNFIVGARDSISPNPENWTIDQIKAATKDPLTVHLHEPLDYVLLKNVLRVMDDKGNGITGTIEIAKKETILIFTPTEAWKSGNYKLEIESILEDLAGNNLNRLFDRDLSKTGGNEKKKIYTKKFRVD
jgi:hypothetical protein